MKKYLPNVCFVLAAICFAYESLLLAFLFVSSVVMMEMYVKRRVGSEV